MPVETTGLAAAAKNIEQIRKRILGLAEPVNADCALDLEAVVRGAAAATDSLLTHCEAVCLKADGLAEKAAVQG